MPEAISKIVLIHLSDIHFMKGADAGSAILDDDVRRELTRDVIDLTKIVGPAHGILVGGDIAFSGKPEEYKRAEQWLSEICQGTKCSEEKVWMVCGNHDVQRDVIDTNKMLRDFQKELRSTAPNKIDDAYAEILKDTNGRVAIFAALQNYNEFARKFGGHFSAEQMAWKKEVVLNDGSKLDIIGVNSAIGSNKEDDDGANKLSLGSARCVVDRVEGREYLLMCHHPPDWLRDAEQVSNYLDSRVRLQLFGHKHKRRAIPSAEHDFHCLKLHAGAVNPDRDDGPYEPRYHALAFHVETDKSAQKRFLCVEMHPRIWNSAKTSFICETADCDRGKETKTYKLPIPWLETDPLKPTSTPTPIEEVAAQPQINNPLSVPVASDQPPEVVQAAWRLSFRFMNLPFHKRMEVASELRLLDDGDVNIDESELFKRLFRRAAQRKLLAEFYDAVEKKYSDIPPTNNPFR